MEKQASKARQRRDEDEDERPRRRGRGDSTTISRDMLKAIVERIERLVEEKDALSGDIRDVYAEAKGQGFDVKTLRQVIRLRKKDTAERQEEESLLDLYLNALGMIPSD